MLNVDDFEVSTTDLADTLEGGDPVQVLDVRAEHRLASGTIEADNFLNVRGSVVMGQDDPATVGLDRDTPIAVVCGHGNASKTVTHFLREKGWPAVSVRGGVAEWMNLLRRRILSQPDDVDEFIQFDRIGKGSLGYLLVSGDAALAVDPSRHWQAWVDAARECGAHIVATADTHVHADFISGSPQMAAGLGVPYYLHPDDAIYPYDGREGRLDFQPLSDGDTIEFGRARAIVHHTPGHTDGSVCFQVGDDAILTGDFIFVGSIGRPDLAGKTEEWTRKLWNSLERAKSEWPGKAVLYPAHYGTDAERNSDLSIGREFEDLLETNPGLQFGDEAAFTEYVAAGIKTPPEAYRTIKAINVGLVRVDPEEAEVLEAGKNECALG